MKRPIQDFRELLEPRTPPRPGAEPAFGLVSETEPGRTPHHVEPAGKDEFAADCRPGETEQRELALEPPALEPFATLLASISPAAPLASEPRSATLPELVASEVVRSIAWGGDRRRGAARLELAGDRFGGMRVVVEVDENRVRLSLDAPPGVDSADVADLRARLCARFGERGLEVESP